MFNFIELKIPDQVEKLQIFSDALFLSSLKEDYVLPVYFESYTDRNEAVLLSNMKIPRSELEIISRKISNEERKTLVFERRGDRFYYVDEIKSRENLYYLVRVYLPLAFNLNKASVFFYKNVYSYSCGENFLYLIVKFPAKLRIWDIFEHEIAHLDVTIDWYTDKYIHMKRSCICLDDQCLPKYCK